MLSIKHVLFITLLFIWISLSFAATVSRLHTETQRYIGNSSPGSLTIATTYIYHPDFFLDLQNINKHSHNIDAMGYETITDEVLPCTTDTTYANGQLTTLSTLYDVNHQNPWSITDIYDSAGRKVFVELLSTSNLQILAMQKNYDSNGCLESAIISRNDVPHKFVYHYDSLNRIYLIDSFSPVALDWEYTGHLDITYSNPLNCTLDLDFMDVCYYETYPSFFDRNWQISSITSTFFSNEEVYDMGCSTVVNDSITITLHQPDSPTTYTYSFHQDGKLSMYKYFYCEGNYSEQRTYVYTWETGVPVSDHTVPLPQVRLEQNYPNPFHEDTRIKYIIEEPSQVSLDIFNIRGQAVRHFRDDNKSAGAYSVQWDGKDDANHSLPSGIYLIQIKAGEAVRIVKAVKMK